jgi:hypothetical protein
VILGVELVELRLLGCAEIFVGHRSTPPFDPKSALWSDGTR